MTFCLSFLTMCVWLVAAGWGSRSVHVDNNENRSTFSPLRRDFVFYFGFYLSLTKVLIYFLIHLMISNACKDHRIFLWVTDKNYVLKLYIKSSNDVLVPPLRTSSVKYHWKWLERLRMSCELLRIKYVQESGLLNTPEMKSVFFLMLFLMPQAFPVSFIVPYRVSKCSMQFVKVCGSIFSLPMYQSVLGQTLNSKWLPVEGERRSRISYGSHHQQCVWG